VRLQLTIKFGFLENLDLPDKNVMKRVDGLACLLNVTTKSIWDPINKIKLITWYCAVWKNADDTTHIVVKKTLEHAFWSSTYIALQNGSILIRSILHVRPPLISDHLPWATAYPKHQNFPSESLTVGTSSKRPPPVSDCDHFLGLKV